MRAMVRVGIFSLFAASPLFVSPQITTHAASGTVTYEYDDLGRLIGVDYGTDPADPSIDYTYDPAGNRTQQVVAGAPNNSLPTAVDGPDGVTSAGVAVTVNPLSNDSDPDGDPISIVGVTQGTNGDVTYTATSVTYTPAGGFTGSDTFSYTIDDDVSGQATADITIVVGTQTSTSSFAVADVQVDESAGTLVFTIARSGVPVGVETVAYTTTPVSATEGDDYTDATGTLTFQTTDSSLPVNVTIDDDVDVESSETFTLTLSNPTGGAVIGTSTATGSITDNDGVLATTFSINDASGDEGDTLTFTITRSGDTTGTNEVNIGYSSGTAIYDTDFTFVPSVATSFGPGETTKTKTVSTIEDTDVESDETFTLDLYNPTNGATISDGIGIGTIVNDDVAPATFSIDDVSVTEGGNLVFTITRSGNTTGVNEVQTSSSSGTATYPSDYSNSNSGVLTFTSGETTKTIVVSSIEDSTVESNETFTVGLSNATGGATISDSSGTGTINNDDVNPASFSVNNKSVSEGNTCSFTVTRGSNTSGSNNVSYYTSNGSAVSTSDYTSKSGVLAFTSGQSTKTVSVSTTENTVHENTESFYLNLHSATGGATISDSQGYCSITDDDPETCQQCQWVGWPVNATVCYPITCP